MTIAPPTVALLQSCDIAPPISDFFEQLQGVQVGRVWRPRRPRRRIVFPRLGVGFDGVVVERVAMVPQVIEPVLYGLGFGCLEQGFLVHSETAGCEIRASDPGYGSAVAAENEDFRVKAPGCVGPLQLTDIGEHSEREGIGQVAPQSDDGPDVRRRPLTLQGAETLVTRDPGSGEIDFCCPGEMFQETGQYLIFGNQHGGYLKVSAGRMLPEVA